MQKHQAIVWKLYRKLNCNKTRKARPKKGSMKDRENSDPSEGEEEDLYVSLVDKPLSDKEGAQLLLLLSK